MMVTLPLERMSISEKLEMMEALWADLSKAPEAVSSPDWHADVLADRKQRADEDPEAFLDWTSAKAAIRERTK